MPTFDASKEWIILLPPDTAHVRKVAEDLSRYIGLLANLGRDRPPKPPIILDAHSSRPSDAIIVLSSENNKPEQNGFSWRAESDRVEIYGESCRGLCNGIYSFLAALGINWPTSGQETLPKPGTDLVSTQGTDPSSKFPLTINKIHEPSGDRPSGHGDRPSKHEAPPPTTAPSAAQIRRFIPAGAKVIKDILKNGEDFAAWAARKRYDAIVFPLSAFTSVSTRGKLKRFKQAAKEYDISLETGGRALSLLVPRKYFLFHRDFFRMEEGRRKKAHHFCPTDPGSIGVINKEGAKLFQVAEGVEVFHLWPDKGAETVWCSCPTCRAFTPAEQNRIAVNAAADVLSRINPGASITFYEKDGEDINIPLRKNLFKLEKLPDGKNLSE